MQRVFIFAEQVKKIIAEGKRDIEIPEGARISAAAAELIKDHKLNVKMVAPQSATATEVPQTDDKPGPPTASQDTPARTAAKTASVDKATTAGDDISDEELEALVNRVVERFKQVKGIAPATSEQKQGAVDESQRSPADAPDDDMIICRCEEITKGEIKAAIRNGMQTVNGIKRVTRAGMGLCQGQTCQRLVTQIIAEELRKSVADIEPTTARGPVRPLNLAVFANS